MNAICVAVIQNMLVLEYVIINNNYMTWIFKINKFYGIDMFIISLSIFNIHIFEKSIYIICS